MRSRVSPRSRRRHIAVLAAFTRVGYRGNEAGTSALRARGRHCSVATRSAHHDLTTRRPTRASPRQWRGDALNFSRRVQESDVGAGLVDHGSGTVPLVLPLTAGVVSPGGGVAGVVRSGLVSVAVT